MQSLRANTLWRFNCKIYLKISQIPSNKNEKNKTHHESYSISQKGWLLRLLFLFRLACLSLVRAICFICQPTKTSPLSSIRKCASPNIICRVVPLIIRCSISDSIPFSSGLFFLFPLEWNAPRKGSSLISDFPVQRHRQKTQSQVHRGCIWPILSFY